MATSNQMLPASDQALLLAYAAARARGDQAAAAQAWQDLAVNAFDRVQQIVKAFRFSPGGPKLPEEEWGSAATEAYLRVVAMGARFEQRETGAFYAALATCVQNACRDFGRKELRHDRRAAGSLDTTFDRDGEAGPYDAALAGHDARLRERSREAVEAERDRLEAEQLVAWGITQIANATYREVLELTYGDKLAGDEIAQRLNVTSDNVYQRRRRGIKELERVLRGL